MTSRPAILLPSAPLAAIRRVPGLMESGKELADGIEAKLVAHKAYVREHGEDMPEIRDWTWPYGTAAEAGD